MDKEEKLEMEITVAMIEDVLESGDLDKYPRTKKIIIENLNKLKKTIT